MAGPTDESAISTLLSQLLVAFTIEFDNEYEHRMPHTTARGPAAHSGRGPWLVSMAMWSNFLRFVDDEPTETADLARLANLPGLMRWGYLTPEIALTRAGRRAADILRPLAAEIDGRWLRRFGDVRIASLRGALERFDDRSLPSALPVVWTGKAGKKLTGWRRDAPLHDLGSVLSRVLLRFALDFEAHSALGLQLDANVLRAVGTGCAIKELPLRSGVSKEAVAGSVRYLEDHGYLRAREGRVVVPTEQGGKAQEGYPKLLARVERAWGDVEPLRSALLAIATGGLSGGLGPYPEGWRAHPPYLRQTRAVLRDPRAALPHYPMVLHRGGYPDGS